MDKRKQLTQKNYSSITDLYASDFGNDNQHFDVFISKLIQILNERKLTSTIIDLGSGPGNVIDYLLKNSVPNKLVAVDFTPEFCEKLREKYKGMQNVRVVYEDFVSYVIKQITNSVSAYIANYSIIHVPNEEVDAFFANVYRSLQQDGIFAFSVWKGTKKGMEKEPYQTQHDSRLNATEELVSYLNNFTEEELEEQLTKVGFKIAQIKTFKPTMLPGEFPKSKIWVLAEKD